MFYELCNKESLSGLALSALVKELEALYSINNVSIQLRMSLQWPGYRVFDKCSAIMSVLKRRAVSRIELGPIKLARDLW